MARSDWVEKEFVSICRIARTLSLTILWEIKQPPNKDTGSDEDGLDVDPPSLKCDSGASVIQGWLSKPTNKLIRGNYQRIDRT